MPYSVTRWNLADKTAVHAAVVDKLTIHRGQMETDGIPDHIFGPEGGIPEGQYQVTRYWTTIELAQAWVDFCGTIGIPMLSGTVRND